MVLADSDRVSPAPPYSGYPTNNRSYVYGTFTLFGHTFQYVPLQLIIVIRVLQPPIENYRVWTTPRSLATTCGITLVFSSSGYLDVSVLRVASSAYGGCYRFTITGCPIRTSTDQSSFAAPRSFSQLTTSFVASVSPGIHHTPLFASYSCALN